MSEPMRAAREIRPFQKFQRNVPEVAEGSDAKPIYPFEKRPTLNDTAKVVQEAETPDPKGESAQESALFSVSQMNDEHLGSETPAPPPASKESGNSSDESEQGKTDNPSPETSSQPSSSPKNPGWSTPPVPGTPPPTSDPTPKQ